MKRTVSAPNGSLKCGAMMLGRCHADLLKNAAAKIKRRARPDGPSPETSVESPARLESDFNRLLVKGLAGIGSARPPQGEGGAGA